MRGQIPSCDTLCVCPALRGMHAASLACAWILSPLNPEPLDRRQSKTQQDYAKALYYHPESVGIHRPCAAGAGVGSHPHD
jgi:hypothetical protein